MMHVHVYDKKEDNKLKEYQLWVQYLKPRENLHHAYDEDAVIDSGRLTDFDTLDDFLIEYGTWKNLPRSAYFEEDFLKSNGEVDTVERILRKEKNRLPTLVTIGKLFHSGYQLTQGDQYENVISVGMASHMGGNVEKNAGREIALARAVSRLYKRYVPVDNVVAQKTKDGQRKYTVYA